jgi:antitoxin component YwqK of YwqJK toxin-antitoxin module
MRVVLTALVLVMLGCSPSLALGEAVNMEDLVNRDGRFFKQHTRTPFTGEVRGRGFVRDGKREGAWIFFDDNGQRLSEGAYEGGREAGIWVFFHANGQLESRGAYEDGKPVGRWEYYRPDGTRKLEGAR